MKRVMCLAILCVLACACSGGGVTETDGTVGDGLTGDVLPGDGSGSGNLDGTGWGDGKLTGDGPAPLPGEFGAPCTSNDDCKSGFCIEGLDGYICTSICVEDCPGGYNCVGVNIGPDVVFICVPDLDRSCELCTSDLQCSGGRCINLGGNAKYCLAPCDTGSCKGGYECKDVQAGGGTSKLCTPTSGTCECSQASLGLEKACKQKSGTDVCYGIQFCEAAGWGQCTLPDEICDAKDNDCNGIVDDGMLNPATGKYDTDAHCGVCNNSCKSMTGSHAFGACDKSGAVPVCGWSCEAGYFDVNDNPNDGCECKLDSNGDDPDTLGDANCDGIDGEVANGIFVAKNGDDAVGTGTIDDPVLTVQQGIDLAVQTNRPHVYVATGVYSESILLEAGIHVYGGYSVDFELRNPAINQTVIMGLPFVAEMPGAVNCIDILDIPTTLSGFHVFGGDAIEEGGSSYSIYVKNCNDSVKFVSNVVVAGNGRNGTNGDDGGDGGKGSDGSAGKGAYDILHDKCVGGDWTTPGTGGKTTCEGIATDGGDGGSGVCPDYDESGSQPKSSPMNQSHQAAEWGKDGKGQAGGKGGKPGYDALLWSDYSSCGVCNVPKSPDGETFLPSLGQSGKDGANGANGATSFSCANPTGNVSNGLWLASQGGDGGTGSHGSGGGGGGAGGGVETVGCAGVSDVKYTDVGGSGGGGGSGGCSATGGKGGSTGGASFAVFIAGEPLAASLPQLKKNVIQTGFGGDGGRGGAGGVGGQGGKGKTGGGSGEDKGSAWCADAGGFGGNGGNGGHGGGGGGGCGGPSFGIYLFGASPNLATGYLTSNQFELVGLGGAGGAGGKSMGNSGATGGDGAAGKTNF
ncbi:MAG: hypothetical protein FJ109_07980 [Deltaproteobacteria bacterium]|nr:hypothetical protein [Deltaproteobacteria bacterium]